MSRLPVEVATVWRPAIDEAAARIRVQRAIANRTVVLDGQAAATQRLAEQLLAAIRGGVGYCSHFPPDAAVFASWGPRAERLCCWGCEIVRQARNDADTSCDLCGSAGDGGAMVGVGPVIVLALACDRCRRRRMRSAYDVAAAGRQVVAVLEARRREAAS